MGVSASQPSFLAMQNREISNASYFASQINRQKLELDRQAEEVFKEKNENVINDVAEISKEALLLAKNPDYAYQSEIKDKVKNDDNTYPAKNPDYAYQSEIKDKVKNTIGDEYDVIREECGMSNSELLTAYDESDKLIGIKTKNMLKAYKALAS